MPTNSWLKAANLNSTTTGYNADAQRSTDVGFQPDICHSWRGTGFT
ncbi:hypothetical protein CRENPOLYSF1_660030 [Crenothrix polyspora]|uniref:Uncharacterized protein n=1 Tax=Crenothrix polyspora TaxID=360316 RepID=A0A1R4HGT9_9GAMM|nr:hypothetical protein CRENPOLYSF1_660030 [Crenothrix polyspora]